MNISALLCKTRLRELAQEPDDAALFAGLNSVCIDLYAHIDNYHPAEVIYQVFLDIGQSQKRLCQWVSRRIDELDSCCPTAEDGSIYLADGVFDLAGRLDYGGMAKEKSQVLSSLEKVWSRHEQWRRFAAQFADSAEGWVDPATTAEESLLHLSSKSCLEIRQQAEAVSGLGDAYPDAMRDYCFHAYLCYLAEHAVCGEDAPEAWHQAAGFVFARGVRQWFSHNRFLLEYVCAHIQELADAQWPNLAYHLFLHAKSLLEMPQRKELREILGYPQEPPSASFDELIQGIKQRQPYTAVTQRA
ncbi:MAG: hypothetical protein GY862_34915 [Gammaproteobacteria bacterium]|nr:hypothetical protein [Gammaproteobacteria bacterium]